MRRRREPFWLWAALALLTALLAGAALGSVSHWRGGTGSARPEAASAEQSDEDDAVENEGDDGAYEEDEEDEEDEDVDDAEDERDAPEAAQADDESGKGRERERAEAEGGNAEAVPLRTRDGAVFAAAETDPVPHGGDAADDPALWIHPTDPSGSTIVATDKRGGLAVYDLSGRQLQFLAEGEPNNVDLRRGFRLGRRPVALVTAGDRSNNSLAIYRVDPTRRTLVQAAARRIEVGITPYGSCMYRSEASGRFYVFVTSKDGKVEQWQLFDAGDGEVDARRVRSFAVGSQSEGCVADDRLGHLYVAEETVGIWKYGAEPRAGATRRLVDSTDDGRLTADVEGLAIAYRGARTGYLVASSQGNNSFVVYRREGRNAYVRTFRIDGRSGVDSVEETDGLDVTTASLGRAFRGGLLVVQDGQNDDGNQNFKLVPWASVLRY